MALGAIEFATISRSQDYTTIKHNEDNKGMVDQANFSDQVQKAAQQQTREVQGSEDMRWQESRPDAKEKGNGQYGGDGGIRRKKGGQGKDQKPRERMVVKGQGGFDFKI